MALTAAPRGARAFEVGLETAQRGFAERIPATLRLTRLRFPTTSTAVDARVAYQARLVAWARHRPFDALGVEIAIDTGLLEVGTEGVRGNGLPIGVHARETGFLGKTQLDLELGPNGLVQLQLGKRVLRVADGAIFDGYTFGASLDVDGRFLDEPIPLYLRLDAALPDATFTARAKRSPLLHARVGVEPVEGLEFAALGAVFFDGDDALVPLMEDAIFPVLCAPIIAVVGTCGETRGTLGWLGADLRWTHPRFEVHALGLWGTGSITARRYLLPRENPDRARREGVIGFGGAYGALEARARPLDGWSIGAFGLAVSGDVSQSLSGRLDYGGFMSLSPRLRYLTLFFNAGLGTTLQSPTAATISPDGAGLAGGGLEAEVELGEHLRLRASGAALSALEAPRGAGGRFLGVEVDGLAEWAFSSRCAAYVEGALFAPGAFYGDAGLAYQVFVGFSGRVDGSL